MDKMKELKAYAIGSDSYYQVVISFSKEIAFYWLRDIAGYSNEEMDKFKVWDFPLDRKVHIRDFGEISANELIKEVKNNKEHFGGFPFVVFWKNAENDYFENWHSHFELEDPTED